MCWSSSPYCFPSSSLSSCSSCSCSSSLSLAHGSCVFGRGDSAGMREDARPAVLATWHIQLIRERMCQVASTGSLQPEPFPLFIFPQRKQEEWPSKEPDVFCRVQGDATTARHAWAASSPERLLAGARSTGSSLLHCVTLR